MKKVMIGNHAVSWGVLRSRVEVISAYPITPQTQVVEALSEMVADGRLPAQYVKAYVRGNKNDFNDARAIAEAVRRPDMRFVTVKTVEQQDVQALHRLRAARVGERAAISYS